WDSGVINWPARTSCERRGWGHGAPHDGATSRTRGAAHSGALLEAPSHLLWSRFDDSKDNRVSHCSCHSPSGTALRIINTGPEVLAHRCPRWRNRRACQSVLLVRGGEPRL